MSLRHDDLAGSSCVKLAAAVGSREVGAVELVEAHIARLEEVDRQLNAVVVTDFERSLADARRAARALGDGRPVGPLHGVPFTVKEAIDVEGLPACEASLARPKRRATADATAVARIRAAGGIVLGKTNISEFCAFPDTVNRVYGATRNPHDLRRSAAGSSGGEGAAVAASLSPLGLGSDYGGSIRGPAHFCGVFGFRPAAGAVPLDGHLPERLPMWRARWSTIGPLTRTTADMALALELLSATTVRPSRPVSVTVFCDALERPISEACAGTVEAAVRALEADGFEIDRSVPACQLEIERLFDAVSGSEARSMLEPIVRDHGDVLSSQTLSIWDAVAGAPRRPDAESTLAPLAARAAAWLSGHPVLLAPGAAVPAFELGRSDVGVFDLFQHYKYASALGLPAAIVPITRTVDGLPVGVELIGRPGHEGELIYIASCLEEAFGGACPPDLASRSPASAPETVK